MLCQWSERRVVLGKEEGDEEGSVGGESCVSWSLERWRGKGGRRDSYGEGRRVAGSYRQGGRRRRRWWYSCLGRIGVLVGNKWIVSFLYCLEEWPYGADARLSGDGTTANTGLPRAVCGEAEYTLPHCTTYASTGENTTQMHRSRLHGAQRTFSSWHLSLCC